MIDPASEISHTDGFAAYGLADTGLLVAAKGNYLILTDDLRFSVFAARKGVDCINFNHLRDQNWQQGHAH